MRLLPYGDRALLVEVADLAEARGLHAALVVASLPGVVDLVPAARTVLVVLDESTDLAAAGAQVARLRPRPVDNDASPLVEVPVAYDGADLEEVAALTGLSAAEVVRRHSARELVVAFGGFAPGFAYLSGLDPALHVPRLDSPRTRVPAGSVAVAGPWAAVYPRSSPGGWRLLGRADVALFDPQRDPPALLAPGTRVRFVPVDRVGEPAAQEVPPHLGGDLLVVEAPRALVQDLGRPGHRALGVGAGGAADRAALRLANRLLGNDEGAAGLEVVLGGLVLEAGRDLLVAVTGAPAPADVDGRPVGHASTVRLRAGQRLRLGVPPSGLRSYVGVRGGLDTPVLLGSRATDLLAGLGRPLAAGDGLRVGRPGQPLPDVDQAVVRAEGDLVVRPGPRADWVAGDLSATGWTVTADLDRVGIRLDGPPLQRARTDELPSEGLLPGAVQVPPDGRPVVFLADAPVTGGYPVVGVLDARSLDRAAQLRPGDRVRFRV